MVTRYLVSLLSGYLDTTTSSMLYISPYTTNNLLYHAIYLSLEEDRPTNAALPARLRPHTSLLWPGKNNTLLPISNTKLCANDINPLGPTKYTIGCRHPRHYQGIGDQRVIWLPIL